MKEIRYWTSHPIKTTDLWYRNLALDSKQFRLVYDPIKPDYLVATEHIYTEWRSRIDFKRLYSSNRVALFWAGECIAPDMNIFDYATTFDRGMKLADRLIRRPTVSFFGAFNNEPLHISRADIELALYNKTGFCNFIYSNAHAHPRRDALFYALSKYKKVDSLGRHLRNCNLGDSCDSRNFGDFEVKSIKLKSPYKFSIAAENASYAGYVSEKIITSFLAKTVPIYWGDPSIEQDFNPEAFINANNLDDNELIDIVRKVDNDDDWWQEIVSQPLMTEEQYERMLVEEEQYRCFMEHVFGQSIKAGVRKSEGFWTNNYRRSFFAAKALPVKGTSHMSRVYSVLMQTINDWKKFV